MGELERVKDWMLGPPTPADKGTLERSIIAGATYLGSPLVSFLGVVSAIAFVVAAKETRLVQASETTVIAVDIVTDVAVILSAAAAVYGIKIRQRVSPALCSFVFLESSLVLASAGIYFLASHTNPSGFSCELTKIDALYYAVITFTTIGYGDIVPISQTMRAEVTIDVLINFVMIGVILSLLIALATNYLRPD